MTQPDSLLQKPARFALPILCRVKRFYESQFMYGVVCEPGKSFLASHSHLVTMLSFPQSYL
ncbi:hypothetical protein P7K49_022510, partial [Saguinus oedipus]